MTLTAFPLAFFIILDAYLKNLTSDGCAHIRGRATCIFAWRMAGRSAQIARCKKIAGRDAWGSIVGVVWRT